MTASQNAIDLIERFEGCRLCAYPDPAEGWKLPTIGYGHTRAVHRGDVITEQQAEDFLREDVGWIELELRRRVKVPTTQNQWDALVSFAYNCAGWWDSTLLEKLNAGDISGAADEFPRWDKAMVDGKLAVEPGLVKRREAERALFLTPVTPSEVAA
jgi:lysozyme